MPERDLHDHPFEGGTFTKLKIFESYMEAWLPVFAMTGYKELYIFDFFAGPGYDLSRVPGSPIRFLEKIYSFFSILLKKQVTVHLCLNELKYGKYVLLEQNCKDFISSHTGLEKIVKISYFNVDFDTLFLQKLPEIRKYPSLVYLDQNGIKFLRDDIFQELVSTHETDFIYFVSTSYIKRFGKTSEFRNSLPVDAEELTEGVKFQDIHQKLIEELRKKIPAGSGIKLYPFTIKKGKNIFGIIFGASHPRAVDKFLSIAWAINDINGCANFDIDDDGTKTIQADLFEGHILTKKEKFDKDIEIQVLNGNLKTNKDVYDYTLDQGYLPSQSAAVLRNLMKEKKINYPSKAPLVNYANVYKNPRIIYYEILK